MAAAPSGIDPAIWSALQNMNFPGRDLASGAPQYGVDFAELEVDAQNAGDVFGPTLKGFTFPTNISVGEFSAVEALAHQFAANSNWRYTPTGSMILQAYNAGVTSPAQAFEMWFQRLGPQDKQNVPWLEHGMTQAQYQATQDNFQTVLEKLTGSNDINQMSADARYWATRENWSSAKIESYLRGALGQDKPWLQAKYGYTYQSWQQNKTAHKQDIIQRYGIDAANQDQLYLQNQDNPLAQSQQARGSQVSYQSGSSQSSFYNKNSLMDFGQNAVR